LKVEEAYRAELAEIKKELSEVQSTRGRLQGSLQAIEENVKKGSLSESEAQKRRDKINQDISNTNDKEKQLEEKIKALDRKYGKV
jgi:chromosome segregation ATPase